MNNAAMKDGDPHEYDIEQETPASRNMLEKRIPDRLNVIYRALVENRQGFEPWRLALMVDLVRRHVTVDGGEIKLSAKEFDLLRLLVLQAGRVLTHDFILREIWGPANTEDVQYLRVYVRSLRQKLEKDPTQPQYLLTETGVGYRLKAPD